ncbi:MAG: DNA topoisomerase [Clostridia bacterium]|nr:DNA topoisomerase [Clostridia bacterium]
MILVIAEKPSLGRDIADALQGTVTERNSRFIRKGNYTVTWVFGHMLTLKEPEDYDIKYKKWSLEDLPIFFDNWELKIGQDTSRGRNYETKEQRVNLIGELLRESESVIHAGDPDEEGQLLIDELLRWFDYKKPVMRLNTGDTTKGGLTKALSHMTDNAQSVNEGWSAYARSVADLMIGVNMSRFFTCTNSGALLAVGRVQTPTLGLVVNRDLQIEGHVKSKYYDIFADLDLETADGVKSVTAKYTRKKQKDSENKQITEISEAEEIKNSLAGKHFDNIMVETKTVNEDPPLPFNLVKLQSYCSSHFGYNPGEVMDITQSLRETHKAITYNRSDCQYLSEEHYKEAPKTLAQVIQNIKYKPKELDPTIHSKCFNDKNITAHFAIIPTNNNVDLEKLTERERNVYLAVCKYYMAQFLPKAVKEKTKLTADIDSDYMLAAYSTRVIKKGYLAIFKDAKIDEATVLSDIADGMYSGNVSAVRSEEKETKPPSRYTKATLNEDMTRIAKYVTDKEIKKLLLEKDKDKKGENGSIGTSATRSTIIDSLIKKGYLYEKGKKLVSSELGRELYRILPDEIKKADMTAKWWAIQEDIRSGEKSYTALTENVLDTIKEILTEKYPLVNQTVMTKTVSSKFHKVLGTCPLCGGNIIEGTKGFGCSNWKEPTSCKFTIWKKQSKGPFSKVTISAATVKKLLSGKSVHMKKLVKNNGELFEADVMLKTDANAQYPVQLVFGK